MRHDAGPDDADLHDAAHALPATPSRPRWVVPIGIAALVTAAIVMVATAGSSSPSPRAAGPSTSVSTKAPAPATATTATAAAATATPGTSVAPTVAARMRTGTVPRYLVELPDVFQPERADVFSPLVQADDLSATGVLSQLWATPGATQTTGRWIGINAYPGSGGAVWAPASYLTAMFGIDVAVTPPTTATETTVLSYALGSTLIRLESFGFTLDELAGPLVAISPSASSDTPRGIDVAADAFPGMELRYSGAYDWRQSLIGTIELDLIATRSYNPQYGWIELTVGSPVPDRDALLPFLIGSPTPFLSTGGALGIAGTPPQWWDSASVAQWVDAEGWLVTIRSSLDVAELVALAEQARPAIGSEWDDLQATVKVVRDVPDGATTQGRVTDGVLADGSSWRVSLARRQSLLAGSTYVWRLLVQNADGTNSNEVAVPETGRALVSTAVYNGLTVVTATVPGDFPSGAVLHVERPGLDPITMPVKAAQPDFSVFAAAAGFESGGSFVATIVGADGTVLVTWPAPPAE